MQDVEIKLLMLRQMPHHERRWPESPNMGDNTTS